MKGKVGQALSLILQMTHLRRCCHSIFHVYLHCRILTQIPEWPTEFIKGRSALANPDEPVPIPKYAQDTMDLEAEVRLAARKQLQDCLLSLIPYDHHSSV